MLAIHISSYVYVNAIYKKLMNYSPVFYFFQKTVLFPDIGKLLKIPNLDLKQ